MLKKYPVGTEFYQLCEEIGRGGTATVYKAICLPFQEIVSVKVLDFEKHDHPEMIAREVHTMRLVDHPNVSKAYASFASNRHNLWVVMPYMDAGSCHHVLKTAYRDCLLPEVIIATVLREALKGLVYLHDHGFIHRDVKAGNILLDSHGAIQLGDLGFSACLFDSGDRQPARHTYVGTPCWMAPEVVDPSGGYDFKADIWSFGITALELAHGHAPFSNNSPAKVLFMTLQSPPPGLDHESDKRFSKSFRQIIAMCLVKDPSKRPSAKELLKHPFFKKGKSNESTLKTILKGLPGTLVDRMALLKLKEAEMIAQKKTFDGKKEEMSEKEYKRGISEWTFDIEDIKEQASLIEDFDGAILEEDQTELKTASPNGALVRQVKDVVSTKVLVTNGEDVCKKSEGILVQQRGRFKVTCEPVYSSPLLQRTHSLTQVVSAR
ncbi:Serine/threonine-protein kinase fray2 [Thalictrum thalictroides]|uniref:Serine/threonine-protein kinase fray2 n=1 Tax=Thalictrum thalictroides TaxID=46969 RepID=A0A7J6WMS3_THATH|nr:Serine/threonine-protein kinase fray2 [Thalictrum thalictroides]